MTDEEPRRLNARAESYLDWMAEVLSPRPKPAPKAEKKPAESKPQYGLCWNGRIQSWKEAECQNAEKFQSETEGSK